MKTQQENILEHLKISGPITPLEALNLYGSFRLSAIIFNLRAEGHDIETKMIERNGKHFALYALKTKPEQLRMEF